MADLEGLQWQVTDLEGLKEDENETWPFCSQASVSYLEANWFGVCVCNKYKTSNRCLDRVSGLKHFTRWRKWDGYWAVRCNSKNQQAPNSTHDILSYNLRNYNKYVKLKGVKQNYSKY